jgi:N-acetylneuraminic acid mutarotase
MEHNVELFGAMVLAMVASSGCRSSEEQGSTSEGSTVTGGTSSTEAAATDVATTTSSSGPASSSDASTTTGGSIGLDGAWVSLAPLAAGPRQEMAVVGVDGRVYAIGGFTDAGITALVEVYDPAADAWSAAAELPVAAHHVNAAVVGEEILVLGFLGGIGFDHDARTFRYDPDADAWTQGADMPGDGQGASGIAVLGDVVYVIAGWRAGQTIADVWAYDAGDDAWSPVPDLPMPRDHLTAFAADGRVFAVGGRAGGITMHTDDVLAIEPGAAAWTAVASIPTSRAGMAGAFTGGRFFVAGGEGAPTALGVFAEFETYDPVADRWDALPPMPTPRHGTGAAAVDGIVYVPGGATVEAFGATDIHEAWVPAEG